MYILGEAVHAFCPLENVTETKERAYLTSSSFIIRRKGQDHQFEKEKIRDVRIRHRLYLIPIIAGGIIAPLAVAALMNDLGELWLLMLIIASGLILLYYGFQGGPAITVFTSVKDYDVFIPAVTPQLRSFIAYTNWQLRSADDSLYVVLTKEERENARLSGIQPGKRLYVRLKDIPPAEQPMALKIDTASQQLDLRFHQEQENGPTEIFLGNVLPAENLREF